MTDDTAVLTAPVKAANSVDSRRSYWKATTAAAVACVISWMLLFALISVLWARAAVLPSYARVGAVAAFVVTLVGLVAAALVVGGGLIALHRDRLETAGQPYGSSRPRESRAGRIGSLIRRSLRLARSNRSLHLRPGETVEVRSLDEILSTLGSDGRCDGLLFMPEMAAFCGQRMTVFRRVDKLHDWIHVAGLKRVHDTVQLEMGRCSGVAHGGCQSNCRLRWKETWLRRPKELPAAGLVVARDAAGVTESDLYPIARRDDADGITRYVCQGTELAGEGESIAWGDPRHFLRDWVTGNVRLMPLLTGVAIATFNWAQRTRGGAMFPSLTLSTSKSSPSESLGLRPGDWVRVRPRRRIEETLNDRGRNRGLRFDPEMSRFCGGSYRVSAVLDRVIVESTGEMKQLSIPCIVLDGVRASGEYRGFNPEDEHIFWREIWLERAEPTLAR